MKKLSVAVAICCALATSNASAEVRINGPSEISTEFQVHRGNSLILLV